MSCRETKANSACTSFAQAISGLEDSDVQARFHALKREGQDAETPTAEQYQQFLQTQHRLVNSCDEVDTVRRRSIGERLNSAYYASRADDSVPDGPTFYALKNVAADAEVAAERARTADLNGRLPNMSPMEVDAELAEKYERMYRLMDRLKLLERDVEYAERRVRESTNRNTGAPAAHAVESLDQAQQQKAMYSAKVTKAMRQLGPYEDEYVRRGRWNRYHMVTASNGHLHTSMNCNTTYPTTRYAWNPELSGKAEDEAVAEFGEKCCTVCMPSAPANPNFSGPGRRERAEVEARRAQRAERAAAQAAKQITRPDGTALKTRSSGTIRTVVTAQREYVSQQAYIAWLETNERAGTATSNSIVETTRRDVHDIEQAISYKTGKPVEEIRAEAAPKVARKVARGEW